jgi:hypothetical protein
MSFDPASCAWSTPLGAIDPAALNVLERCFTSARDYRADVQMEAVPAHQWLGICSVVIVGVPVGDCGMATHPQPHTAAEALQTKFDQILPHPGERRRRLHLAGEATAIGLGGITPVAAASSTSTATVA